jgi:hypothetical protein
MLHALLKAEYLIALERRDEALSILAESLLNDFSDTSGTLYNRIQTRINELQSA